MVSSAPAGSGLPIGLIPGALPSDHASRQTLKITATGFPPGQRQSTPRIASPDLLFAHIARLAPIWVTSVIRQGGVDMDLNLKGRIAVVTGSTAGIDGGVVRAIV